MSASRNTEAGQPPRQLSLTFDFRPALERDAFVVAPCNELAVGWIDRWPDWPGNALVLHGPQGCGKTHLADVWRGVSNADVLNDGTTEFDAIRSTAEAGQALLLEDVDKRLSDAPEWQEALFHLYNAVRLAGGTMMMTARHHPSDWTMSLPDLASRIRAVPAIGIALPDDALLADVMLKQFSDRQLEVEEDLVRYVLPRIERSFPAIHDFVDRIDRLALERRRKVARPLAVDLLKQLENRDHPEDARKGDS